MTFNNAAMASSLMILCAHLSVLAAAFVSPSALSISITPHCFSTLVDRSSVVHANRLLPLTNYFGRQRHHLMLRSTTEETDTTSSDDDILAADATTSTDTSHKTIEDAVRSMKISDIKSELQSLGVSTKTFLEKSELVHALVSARKDGTKRKQPINSSNDVSSTSTSTTSTSNSGSSSSIDRKERMQNEMKICNALKVGELKLELESYGISTKSYFEKSEFVRAVAEARVDGRSKSSVSPTSNEWNKKKKRRGIDNNNDDHDDVMEETTKAKVEVITNADVGPRTKKSRENDSSNNNNSSNSKNPMGGGNSFGGPMGGGGGIGGGGGMDMASIADMLKNMGGMGGGGNPFGGGGNMADMMKTAQQAMSNPKVRAVMDKAQKDPKVMMAVQECMGNPMAMTKYMNDPDVGPILKELQEAMM